MDRCKVENMILSKNFRNLPIQTKSFSDINEMRRCEKSSAESTITQDRFGEGAGGSLRHNKIKYQPDQKHNANNISPGQY